MKRKREPTAPCVVDCSAARADAVRRLGDRYLLAKPINGKHDSWRQLPADLGVPKSYRCRSATFRRARPNPWERRGTAGRESIQVVMSSSSQATELSPSLRRAGNSPARSSL